MTNASRSSALRALALAALACLVLLAARGAPPARAADAAPAPGLQQFGSCADLVAYVRARAPRLARSLGSSVGRPMPLIVDSGRTAIGGEAVAAPATPGAAPPAAGVDYSGTNNQEAGVDEPDLVKTDGRRMFVVDGSRVLRVLDVTGGTPKLVASVDLPTNSAHDLLLSGDRLLVFSEPTDEVRGLRSEPGAPLNLPTGGVQLLLLDVADPAGVKVLERYVISGWLLGARLTGTTVRVVTQATPNLTLRRPAIAVAQRSTAEARRVWRRALKRSTAANWLPVAKRLGGGKAATHGPAVGCRSVHRPRDFSGVGTVTVSTLDVTRGVTPVDVDAVLADGGIIYASTTGLYVATQRSIEFDPSSTTPPPPVDTIIHRFDTSTPDSTAYLGSGQVRGSLLNQFSMSEQNGVLRVASTETAPWWTGEVQNSESFVTTLVQGDGRLDQAGRVGGLGQGERIYAVRFIGDLGYVVTFRQVDPLYVVDLADPANPTVRGALKIRGYSAYLHPIGPGLLLGVGQDASDEGRVQGTQVALFDVSNPAAPVRLSQLRLPGGWSDAEWNHHAFLWWAASSLAVMPVWVPSADGQSAGFVGALAVTADRAGGIGEFGRVTHPDTTYEPIAVPAPPPNPSGGSATTPVAPDQLTSQPTPIVRSLVVGDSLLTVSAQGVKASRLSDLHDLAWVPFPGANQGGPPIAID